jgi:hypothetical protein
MMPRAPTVAGDIFQPSSRAEKVASRSQKESTRSSTGGRGRWPEASLPPQVDTSAKKEASLTEMVSSFQQVEAPFLEKESPCPEKVPSSWQKEAPFLK